STWGLTLGRNAVSRWLGMLVLVVMLVGTPNAFAQSRNNSPSDSRYIVAGLALGSRVQFDSSDYREYKCSPSDQFDGFTWCQKTRQERGFANVTYSILHSQDGTIVYANRFQEPAFFGRNEADETIRQYSTKIGEKAQIKKLPRQRGVPEGILATWGKVVLEPLDHDSINILAGGGGKSQKREFEKFRRHLCPFPQGRLADLPH